MTFQVSQKVLFRHCDPAGIVFYPRYLEMVNDAVEAFFCDALAYPFETLHETHGVPTVALNVRFKAVSRHGDHLTLSVVPTRIGGASADVTVTCSSDAELRFSADLTLVHVNNQMESQRWPDAVRDRLTAHLPSEEKELSHG